MGANWQFLNQKLWLCVPLITSGVISFFGNTSLAQTTPDQTLGQESSIVTPVNPNGNRIDGGAVRGSNLFHSFKDFNVGEGQRIDFANPTDVENIFSRVTGGNRSDIFGTLGVLGDANLFLLNPNGIIFGSNAQLDIRGSFVASTANSFSFADGLEYSANNPQAPPLLKVNFTPGLQIGGKSPGAIVNEGNLVVGKDLIFWGGSIRSKGQLAAPQGQLNVEAVAGDVQVRDVRAETAKLSASNNLILEESQLGTIGNLSLLAQNTVRVRDSITNPFVAKAGGKLLVQGNQGVDIFALNHPGSGFASGGNMVLRSANTVGGDAHYWSGGSFRIEKLDGNLGDLYSPYDPIIRSQGDVSFNSYIGNSLHILAGGRVDISDFIVITGKEAGEDGIDFISEEVTLSDGEKISIDGKAQPTLDIRAGVKQDVINGFPEITGQNNDDFFNADISNLSSNSDFSFTNSSNINSSNRADIKVGTIVFANIDNLLRLLFINPNINLSEIISDNFLSGTVLLTNKYQPNTQLQGDIEVSSTVDSLLPNLVSSLDSLLQNQPISLDSSLPILQNFPNLAIQIGDVNDGGSVTVDSRGSINLNGIINVSAIPNNLNSDNLGFDGNGGDVKFLADNNIILKPNSLIASIGKLGGKLTLESGNELLVEDSGVVSLTTMTAGEGKGKPLIIKAKNSIGIINNNGIDTSNLQQLLDIFGAGSDSIISGLNIINNSGSQGVGSGLATTTLGSGDAGDLTIDETAKLTIKNNSSSNRSVVGLATTSLRRSTGDGGKLFVNADEIEISGNEPGQFSRIPNDELANEIRQIITGITSATQANGNAGEIKINTSKLTIQNGAAITAGIPFRDENAGDGGILNINANESIKLTGKASLASGTRGSGFAGELILNTGKLILEKGAVIASDTSSSGDAGDLNITADRLSISDGSRIGAATAGKGNGANITIKESSLVELAGSTSVIDDNGTEVPIPSGIFANSQGSGKAGNIDVDTEKLIVRDGAVLSTQVSNTSEEVGGNLAVSGNILEVTGGGQLRTTTEGKGDAGNITLDVTDQITLEGNESGLFANTDLGSEGKGGNILTGKTTEQNDGSTLITPQTVKTVAIRNGAKIGVDSEGKGEGGEVEIQAGSLTLDNKAAISAETTSNTGGDINLKVQDVLLMRNQSNISTTAGTNEQPGDGGNITISSGFLVTVPNENSDITANAFEGSGGKINIASERIFWMEPRNREELVEFNGSSVELDPSLLLTNDITAFSQQNPDLDGLITIDLLNTVDPSRGLTPLPTAFVDPSELIDQTCTLSSTKSSSQFVNTGRGGLPQSPSNPLNPDATVRRLAKPIARRSQSRSPRSLAPSPDNKYSESIVEAQGWVKLRNGKIRLVAQAPSVTPQGNWQTTTGCYVR